MNRLQKKCIIASTGFHLLLALILLIGPGFLAPSSKMQDAPLLTFIPYKTTDDDRQGGGSPNGGAPLPPPPRSAVTTPPAPAQREEARPEPVKPKPEPKEVPLEKDDSFAIDTKKTKPKVEISTKVVKRDVSNLSKAKEKEAAEAKAAAEARAEALNRFSRSIDRIGGDLSGGTSIELKGPGGGGVPYANFLQGVKKIYTDAWIVPDGINDDAATVAVTVTIGRDGTVISSRITRRSGDAAVDQSVQMTLDRVTKVCPLPDDSKDSQRTVTINFNVKAKLLG